MNPSQRNAAIVFLAAIAFVAVSEFHVRAITLIFCVLLLILILVAMVQRWRKLARTPVSTLSRKLIALCVVTAIGMFAITEFEDIQGRRLILFNQAVTALHASPAAARLLGPSIRVGWPVKPTGFLSNDTPEAHLSIPVSGTGRSARLIADGVSAQGTWTITNLQLVQNGTIITLASATAMH
jgi:hypothetical protein